jgi:hypothetical protein
MAHVVNEETGVWTQSIGGEIAAELEKPSNSPMKKLHPRRYISWLMLEYEERALGSVHSCKAGATKRLLDAFPWCDYLWGCHQHIAKQPEGGLDLGSSPKSEPLAQSGSRVMPRSKGAKRRKRTGNPSPGIPNYCFFIS